MRTLNPGVLELLHGTSPNLLAAPNDFSDPAWTGSNVSVSSAPVSGAGQAWLVTVVADGGAPMAQDFVADSDRMRFTLDIADDDGNGGPGFVIVLQDVTTSENLAGFENFTFATGDADNIIGDVRIVPRPFGWWRAIVEAPVTPGHTIRIRLGWDSTATAGQSAYFAHARFQAIYSDGFNTHVRAWVANADGTYKNLLNETGELITGPSDFTNDAWGHSTFIVTPNGGLGPDGSMSATVLEVNTTSGTTFAQNIGAMPIDVTSIRYEVIVAKGSGAQVANSFLLYDRDTGTDWLGGLLNYDTGEWTPTHSGGYWSVTPVEGGFWKVTLTATNIAAGHAWNVYIGWTGSTYPLGESLRVMSARACGTIADGCYFQSLDVDFDLDQPLSGLTLVASRGGNHPNYSLAPLNEESLLNRRDDGTTYATRIDAGRSSFIEVAITELGGEPSEDDFFELWRGYIDKVNDDGESTITLTGRDLAAPLADARFLTKYSFQYPPDDGLPLEQAIGWFWQQIYETNTATIPAPVEVDGSPALFVPEPPDYLVRSFTYEQGDKGWDRLVHYAQLIGWDLRYKWNDDEGRWKLTLADPGRTKTTPDVILAPDHYLSIQGFDLDRENVNNDFTWYYGPSGLPGIGRRSYHTQIADSVSRYGFRPVVGNEDEATSPIDTDLEVKAMVDEIASDVSLPKAQAVIHRLFAPFQEINDLIRIQGNGSHSSVDQDLAATRITHHLERDDSHTDIEVRGKPASHYDGWFVRAAKPPTGKFGTATPTIGPATSEATARGGNDEGCVHVPVVFERNTRMVRVYVNEEASSPSLPDRTPDNESNMSPLVRHEGDTASASNWATGIDVSVTPGYAMRLLFVPINPNDVDGPVTDMTVTPADSGTGPSGTPSGFTVTPSVVDDVPQNTLAWTQGDATAQPRIWRNGYLLIVLDAGTTTFEDVGIDPARKYTYGLDEIKNGQTSAVVTATVTAGSVKLATPSFIDPTPSSGGLDGSGNALVNIQFINPDPYASTKIFMNNQSTDGGAFSVIATLGPGNYFYQVNEADVGGSLNGVDRWFTLTSIRDGYTESDTATDRSATFGSAA